MPSLGRDFLKRFSRILGLLGGRPPVGLTALGRPVKLMAAPLGQVRRGLDIERLRLPFLKMLERPHEFRVSSSEATAAIKRIQQRIQQRGQ